MNCANHPDRERSAFCQNCGKPLCNECVRNVGASVFCEPCFGARAAGATAPGYQPVGSSGYTPGSVPPAYPPGPGIPSQPNPGLAALLGFIPGVGAMYNEQYAKGIVHLLVFAILVSLSHDLGVFWLFVWGWIFYMVIEAHHTARARRDGTPLPNPFGLNDLSERLGFGKAWPNGGSGYAPFTSAPFTPNPNADQTASSSAAPDGNTPNPNAPPANSYTPPPYTYAPPPYSSFVPPVSNWGAPQDAYSYGAPPTPPMPPIPPVPPMPPYSDPNVPYSYPRRFPAGAVWLIGLGLFFLVGNLGIFHFVRARYFGPILLIGFGVWMFVRRMTFAGGSLADDGTPAYHVRLALAFRSAIWTILIGIIWLLDLLHILSWGHSWPILLIAGGVMLLLKSTVYGGCGSGGYGYPGYPYPGYPSPPAPTPETPATSSTAIVPTHRDPSGPEEGR
jgi:B-box zinc finger